MKPKVNTSTLLCPQRDCITKIGTHANDRPIIATLNEKAIENEVNKRNRAREKRAQHFDVTQIISLKISLLILIILTLPGKLTRNEQQKQTACTT